MISSVAAPMSPDSSSGSDASCNANVAVEEGHRVRGQAEAEPRVSETGDHGIVVVERRSGGARIHQADGPRMPSEHRARRLRTLAQRRLPGRAVGRKGHFGDVDLDHSVVDVVLARDVVGERHRLDPEVPGEFAHAERVEPLTVGERNGRPQGALPGPRRPCRLVRCLSRHHASACRPGDPCRWPVDETLDTPYNVWWFQPGGDARRTDRDSPAAP